MTVILGIKTDNRLESAICIQRVLTEFGCFVRTRLGLHEISENYCSKYGLIILEILNDEKAILIENKLLDIEGIETQRMIFSFE